MGKGWKEIRFCEDCAVLSSVKCFSATAVILFVEKVLKV